MTDHFEVHHRDGAARVAELRLSDPLSTPALVDEVLTDAGSLWSADRDVPEGSDAELTVLPHRAMPPGTEDEVREAFAVDYPDVDYPSAAVVDSETATDHGTDAYALSTARGVVGHGSAFVGAVVDARRAIPEDAALYLSGVATPRNVATMAYAGVDLFDADRAVIKGTQGKYLTTADEHFLEDLDELPCACPACRGSVEAFDREDCADHNVAALRAELARVRRRIRDGRLRDYVEGQARQANWLTAAMRELDDEWGYVEERTPLYRGTEMQAATGDSIRRPEIRRFADRVTTRYECRFRNPLVLVPCSAAKPYTESQSHRQFADAIQFRAHKVSMTSPIGVVPQELEYTYPAQHYDAVVTGRWSEAEVEFVADVLERYLQRNDYPRVIAHVPPGGYREVCERVADRVGIPFEFTVEDHPTTVDAIANLQRTLEGELKYARSERHGNAIRGIADFQFGEGAGDELFPDLQTASRLPKLRADDADGTQLAQMVPEYGTLSLTLSGARRWVESNVPVKRVEIDDFVPHGSVLAPGIVDADEAIRPGDEVVVEGPRAFGIGRAETHGRAMVESTRGEAVDVRHVEEK
jgi:archaeosine synthase